VHCVCLVEFPPVSTHLEQIHLVPAPTRKEDLFTVQLAQPGIQWSLLEHGCVHVCSEYERVGVSIVSNVVFTSDVSKGTLARLVPALEVSDLLSYFVPQLGVICICVQTVVVYHEIKGRVDELA
jgi:hypothetical protein